MKNKTAKPAQGPTFAALIEQRKAEALRFAIMSLAVYIALCRLPAPKTPAKTKRKKK